jgi:hypothetical protein
MLDQDPLKVIKNGMRVRVNADDGTVEVLD